MCLSDKFCTQSTTYQQKDQVAALTFNCAGYLLENMIVGFKGAMSRYFELWKIVVNWKETFK